MKRFFYVVAICPDEGTIRSSKANARLIATAPELLEACKEAQAWLFDMQTDSPYRAGTNKTFYEPILDILNKAIAKAEGSK